MVWVGGGWDRHTGYGSLWMGFCTFVHVCVCVCVCVRVSLFERPCVYVCAQVGVCTCGTVYMGVCTCGGVGPCASPPPTSLPV